MKLPNKQIIWLVAGGTGGHISPAIAVSESFLTMPKTSVVFISLYKNQNYADIQNLKEQTNEKNNLQTFFYNAPVLPKNIKTALLFLPKLCWALLRLFLLYLKNKPLAVLTFGGYPVFPALVFAIAFRIPLFFAEQNAMPGMITRRFAKFAKKTFLALPTTIFLPKQIITGNPIRQKIYQRFFDANGKRLSNNKSKNKIKQLLFVGGSQGAKDLNHLYLTAIEDSFFENFQIEISTGKTMYEELVQKAKQQKRNDTIVPFIRDMHRALHQADAVISRSGSGMVFEISAAGKPAIYFPFAFATDNHQAANAQQLEKWQIAQVVDIRPFATKKALLQLKKILASDIFFDKAEDIYKKDTLPIYFDGHRRIVEHVLQYLKEKDKR